MCPSNALYEHSGAPVYPTAAPNATVELDPLTKDVVEATAQMMMEMSLEEKDQLKKDIYGLPGSEVIEESPEFIRDKMSELQQEIDQLPPRKKRAYCVALDIDKDYVQDVDFCIAFLRAERFDIPSAATRLLFHLDLKLEIYGRDLLCRNIQQSDLDPVSLRALYEGVCVDCPLRDLAGRHVGMFVITKDMDLYNIPLANRMKAGFYCMCVAGRDIDTQKRGRVFVVWLAGLAILGKAMDMWQLTRLTAASPYKYQAFHMCIDVNHPTVLPAMALSQMAMTARLRVYVQRHIGTVPELRQTLKSYGLPADFIPIGDDGKVVLDMYRARWRHIANQESCAKSTMTKNLSRKQDQVGGTSAIPGLTAVVEDSSTGSQDDDKPLFVNTPTNSDVLMGKGRGIQEHLGNVRFRKLIEYHLPQYETASKPKKTGLSQEIIRIVEDEWKGRFLTASNRMWVPMTDELKLRSKVSVCFRDAKKQRTAKIASEGTSKTKDAAPASSYVPNALTAALDNVELPDFEMEGASYLDDLNDDPAIELLLPDWSKPGGEVQV